MEQFFSWLLEEAVASWIFLALGAGGAGMLKVFKSRWPFIAGVLRHAIIGLIVAFVFILLVSQLERLAALKEAGFGLVGIKLFDKRRLFRALLRPDTDAKWTTNPISLTFPRWTSILV